MDVMGAEKSLIPAGIRSAVRLDFSSVSVPTALYRLYLYIRVHFMCVCVCACVRMREGAMRKALFIFPYLH